MTLLFMDSFDHYTIPDDLTKKYESVFGATLAANAGGRTNGCISGTRISHSFSKTVGAITGKIIFGFGVYFVAGVASGSICSVCSKLYPNVTLFRNADSTISAYRRTGTSAKVLLGTSAASPLSEDTWHYIEAKIFQSATVGTVEVWVNGTPVLSLTNQNTMPNSDDGPYTAVSLFLDAVSNGYGAGAGNGTLRFDDFYICDDLGTDNNDILGEPSIYVIYPDADTGPNDWTPSAAVDHNTLVDEHDIDEDTTYLEVMSATAEEIFGLEDSPVAVGSVAAIQVNTTVRKTTPGGATYTHRLQQSGAAVDGATQGYPSGSTYGMNSEPFDKDPTDSVDWSFAKVNSLKAGVKRNA